ncbi:ATP-binding protein [Phenylobacterium sp. J367]|uniref:hybrid sensor histidine kinase/response regulator n=1 Tax=Phenylobacterium sp. J367 TaxID=2898435 RepID=UPI002150A706|nr:ATP-binding protein [Phenylobacterium sp. J367]MCR5879495.1 ATP-binding protein [Phenylobacterium sp. J367]
MVGEQLRELDAARAAAERTSRAKSRLLAEVAHELRTPLQGAVGLLGGEAAESIDAGALRGVLRHLATVVDDLADMGALEAGGIALAAAPFSPARTVDEVRATFMLQAGGRRLEVTGDPPPALVGDEVRLRQVLSNLVSNALKHGQGTVTVALAATPLDGDAELRLEVWDEGAGLPDAELTRVFEPFQRGPAGQAVEGLGLGLPIARRIARAMGGELRARQREGRTVFVFQVRLPLASEAPVAPDRGLPRRLLLAEDVELSRRVLARLLAAEGCEVAEAADGAEAFALLTTRPFDLVLTDQRMPGMTGSELCRRARAQGFRGRIAIATGADDPHLRAEVADLDGVTVIRKPLDRDGLRAWLAADPAVGPAPDVVHGRVQELFEALGPEADAIFRELPAQLDRLLAELAAAIRAAAPADQVAAAAHRLAGFAAHFGLAEVAAQSRRLEGEALADAALTPAPPESALRAIRAAARAVDWGVYAVGEGAETG